MTFSQYFIDLGQNRILGVTLIAWFIAQFIKVVIGFYREKRFNFKWFIGTGGMPSSHACGVTAMAVCVGLQFGFDSAFFAMAAVFALVTMFDAQGVRYATGRQARALNKLVDEIYSTGHIQEERLKELIGHTPIQVLIGFLLGLILAVLLY